MLLKDVFGRWGICVVAFGGLIAAQPLNAAAVCEKEAEALNQVDKKYRPLLNEKKNAETALNRWELKRKRLEGSLLKAGCRDKNGAKITEYPMAERLEVAKQICEGLIAESEIFPKKHKACIFVKQYPRKQASWVKSCGRNEDSFARFLQGSYKTQGDKQRKILSDVAAKLAENDKIKAAATEALRVCKEVVQSKAILFDFEKYELQTTFPYGQGFADEGIAVRIGHFYWLTGEGTAQHPETMPHATITQGWETPEAEPSKALYPLSATVNFSISGCASEVSFQYSDGGGNVNLVVHEERANVEKFSGLNGKTLGGATVTYTPPPHRPNHDAGTITLKGSCIKYFGFGGTEALFDNVKITVRPASTVPEQGI